MNGVVSRTAAVAIALTALASVVALAGREPVRGVPSAPEIARPAPERFVLITPDFPVPGALPPETFQIEEEPVGIGWLRWLLAAVGLILVLAVALVVLRNRGAIRAWRWGRRRARTRLEPAEALARERDDDAIAARQAVDAALEPLRHPADPREAVIAAYARMQRVLATRELGRRTPEAPREHLTRVLAERGMPEGSLTTLTSLFEEARFSAHAIPESAPRRAREELEKARSRSGRCRVGWDARRNSRGTGA